MNWMPLDTVDCDLSGVRTWGPHKRPTQLLRPDKSTPRSDHAQMHHLVSTLFPCTMTGGSSTLSLEAMHWVGLPAVVKWNRP